MGAKKYLAKKEQNLTCQVLKAYSLQPKHLSSYIILYWKIKIILQKCKKNSCLRITDRLKDFYWHLYNFSVSYLALYSGDKHLLIFLKKLASRNPSAAYFSVSEKKG